jgi:hypothetical protein
MQVWNNMFTIYSDGDELEQVSKEINLDHMDSQSISSSTLKLAP